MTTPSETPEEPLPAEVPGQPERFEPWIWSIVFGLLSGLSHGLTAVPGFILGVVALRKRGESRANRVGAIIGIALCSVGLVLLFWVSTWVLPAWERLGEQSDLIESVERVGHLTNAIRLYALVHEGKCPASWDALITAKVSSVTKAKTFSPRGNGSVQYILLMPGADLDELPEDTALVGDINESFGESVMGYANGEVRLELFTNDNLSVPDSEPGT